MRGVEIMKWGAILAAGVYIASHLTPGHAQNSWQSGQDRTPALSGEAAAHGPLHGILSRLGG